MGISPFRSSFCSCGTQEYMPTTNSARLTGNPDPANFNVISTEQRGKWLICVVEYPDCQNYEGRKVLVFHDVDIQELFQQERLDPHFCDTANHISPVARFEPTERGLQLARKLVR